MKEAVDFDLSLCANDCCLVYQHKDVNEIERNLNQNFSNVCDWFTDNKLSIHLGEDKTKCILFDTKHHRLTNVSILRLNMVRYTLSNIMQRHTSFWGVNSFKSYKQN